ncbi:hypothetical protein RSSM_06281 [Rhodopirellula sallentina SM41]|uniref:Uncharacterized protein n=1 Tax=Rhodopirellula sallentina SM41 TaxID=1263870 RepID=M5U8K3_9BACT|nr:hypothetical protein RSSM_06281 [Rhodopirellula sallentina SM41]
MSYIESRDSNPANRDDDAFCHVALENKPILRVKTQFARNKVRRKTLLSCRLASSTWPTG